MKLNCVELLVFAVMNAAWIAGAQEANKQETRADKIQIPSPTNPLRKSWNFAWLEKDWTSSHSEAYIAFRKDVDRLGALAEQSNAAKAEILALAIRCRGAAKQEPVDPYKHFRHAYSAYMVRQTNPSQSTWEQVGFGEALQHFKTVPPPPYVEYARLAFLMQDLPMPHSLLRHVGKRLLSISPSDRRVAYTLVQITNPTLSVEEREDAIRLADDFVQKWPDFAKGYALRAGVYYTLFFNKFSRKEEGLKAIENYTEYLKRTPKNASTREVQKTIDFIREHLKS